MAGRRKAGRVELAVRRDLRVLSPDGRAGRATMMELAQVLAQAIDALGDDGPAPMKAKLAQELRAVMSRLMEVAGDSDDARDFAARMSSPVRLAAVSGAGDAGSAGGGDRRKAG